MKIKPTNMLLAAAVALAITTPASADKGSNTGSFGFEPIAESANKDDWEENKATPWKLPEGFSQSIVSDETDLNIYSVSKDEFPEADNNDWHDMNTVNETGKMAGRYLYRTHEVRLNFDDDKKEAANQVGGVVSVVDLKTGETKIIAQEEVADGENPTWTALDGIRWTPWGTIVFAEETAGGRFFEMMLDKKDLMTGTVIERPAVGLMAHEGIDVGADGSIYVVDEHRGQSSGCVGVDGHCGGGVYKFVPHQYGNLESGDLYMLKVTGEDGVGHGEWVGPIEASDVRLSGAEEGGTSYQRPEDLEIIANTLYVAVTEGSQYEEDGLDHDKGDQKYDGRIISVNLETMKVSNFVKGGMNAPLEIGVPGDDDFQSGLDNPDNLAESPDGKLIIIEDNKPSDIWFASTQTDKSGASVDVSLFASLTDPSAEGTGVYFGKDPKTMFVNVQHSATPDGDATWAITKD